MHQKLHIIKTLGIALVCYFIILILFISYEYNATQDSPNIEPQVIASSVITEVDTLPKIINIKYQDQNVPISYDEIDYSQIDSNISINETKLIDFLKTHLDLPIAKISPQIIISSLNESLISNCLLGTEGTKVQFEELIEEMKSNKQDSYILKQVDDKFSEEELSNQNNCKAFINFEKVYAIYNDKPFLSNVELHSIFQFSIQNQKLKVTIANKEFLKTKLVLLKASIDTPEEMPQSQEFRNQIYILNMYKPGSYLNIQDSISNIENSIKDIDTIGSIPIAIDRTNLPNRINGKPVNYFPQTISNGKGRMYIPSYNYTERRDEIIKGLSVLNGLLIQPNVEQSLTQTLNAKLYAYNSITDQTYPITRGNAYGTGICGVSTIVFRALLEAGLPIIERHPHEKALRNYSYPYRDALIDSALFFRTDALKDLKFVNDTNKQILVTTNAYEEGDYFYYSVKFYGDSEFVKRKVTLDDFSRSPQNSKGGFSESFTRNINGSPEIFSSNYYASDFRY